MFLAYDSGNICIIYEKYYICLQELYIEVKKYKHLVFYYQMLLQKREDVFIRGQWPLLTS